MLMVKIRTGELEESREDLTCNLVEYTYEIRWAEVNLIKLRFTEYSMKECQEFQPDALLA